MVNPVWRHKFSMDGIYVEIGPLAYGHTLFHTGSNFASVAEAWRGGEAPSIIPLSPLTLTLTLTPHPNGQVSEQKLALLERLNSTEHTLSALRGELQQREEDFQVDLGLFATRDVSGEA